MMAKSPLPQYIIKIFPRDVIKGFLCQVVDAYPEVYCDETCTLRVLSGACLLGINPTWSLKIREARKEVESLMAKIIASRLGNFS